MANRHMTTQFNNSSVHFRLKPLSACVRMAIAGGVFIGSVSPVLAELPVASQVWESMGQATRQEIGNTLQINQQSQNAILNWEKFNVGVENTVQFNQPSTSSIALNRIFDQNPSQILGKVTANGQIYLHNQNGFVFGENSVVNANTFLASTLHIADEALNNGILKQVESGKHALGAEDNKPETATKAESFITVKKGAQLKAVRDASKNSDDGMILLAAPNVENKGSITTDEYGQIILVASKDKVYLQPTDNNSPFKGMLVEVDTGGKVSNVGEILARQGNVTLQGFSVNQGGRVTATTSVNVNGSIRLLAKEKHIITSGKLLAEKTFRDTDTDGLGTEASVTFEPGSVTEIIPDDKDTTEAIDLQSQKKSYFEVIANKVELKGSKGVSGSEDYKAGAAISAKGGKVNIITTNDLTIINPFNGQVTLPENPASTQHPGQILMDKGSSIDVSGTKGVKAAMERNVAEISVQTFDLRDSPEQKNGVLQGQTVRVDVRQGSQLVDTTGATNSIKRGIEERLGKGGEINLTAGGDVIVNGGAVDISGGSVDYQDGYIDTTKLLTDYGNVVDIGVADPDEHYASIFGVVTEVDEKWGVTKVYNILEQFGPGRFEKGYTEGQSAGALNIQSPLLAWKGELTAGSESGRYQRESTIPFGGSFTFNQQDGISGRQYVSTQNVRFQAEKTSLDLINGTFPTHTLDNREVPDDLVLSASIINQSHVQNVLIKTSGGVEVSENASLAFTYGGTPPFNPDTNEAEFAGTLKQPGGNLTLDAANIDIKGNIYSPGGSINLATHILGGGDPAQGEIKLHGTSTMDVSGLWVNDFQKGLGTTPTEPTIIDAGRVNVVASGDLTMDSGASIKADGGAWLTVNNDLAEGRGGDIKLAAVGNGLRSLLSLDGELSVYGLSHGGTLSLASEKIIVASKDINVPPSDIKPLILKVDKDTGSFDFAKDTGYSKINLTSVNADFTVMSGTTINLRVQNRVLKNSYRDQPSGSSIAGFTDAEELPEHLRQPADLSLNGVLGVTLEKNTEIIGDKESSISLQSNKGIYVDGLINAPSGKIELTTNADPNVPVHDATQAIWLGSNSQLLAKGTTRMNPPDAFGRRTGTVLDGGEVKLTANRGYVIQRGYVQSEQTLSTDGPGSLIDVTGTRAVLDLPVLDASFSPGVQYQATEIGSDGGHIAVTAAEGIVLDGSLYGKAGSETTQSGRLDVAMDRSERQDPALGQGVVSAFTYNPMIIKVRQNSGKVLDNSLNYGDALDDFSTNPGSINKPDSLNGKAFVNSQLIEKGGFGDLRLDSPGLAVNQERQIGEVHFQGNVDLGVKERIEINTRKIAWEAGPDESATNAGGVVLDTAYLKIGADEYFIDDLISAAPKSGNGTFTTQNTQLIELIGKSRWDGFSEINLGSEHDLRTLGVYEFKVDSNNKQIPGKFAGSMTTAANLNLSASQIYPATLTNFTFDVVVKNNSANNNNGQININGKNTDKTPLTANGVLDFKASVINQNGILKAPFGSINLQADKSITLGDGSMTSVSADKQIIPFGVTSGGLFWLYPLNSNVSQVYNSSPDFVSIQSRQVNFDAPIIRLKKGSVVDISGGGDLQAYEFLEGAGGSNDYLDPNSSSYEGGFAILPSLGSTIAPFDPSYQLAGFDYKPGSSVYLNGTNELAAGTYTILPSRYALLDGAFLVTPQANSQDKVLTSFTIDGLPIVPGYQIMAGTGTRDARWSGFRIEQGVDVRKQSQYDENKANDFFEQQALDNLTSIPLIPKDSGQIVMQNVVNKLTLEGSINSAPDQDINGLGKGGKLDISSDSITVVDKLSAPSAVKTLKVLDRQLRGLKLDSLFLGGIRRVARNAVTGENETTFTIKAKDVTFSDRVKVKAKDVVAAATSKVIVKSKANLTVSGKVNTGDTIFNVIGDGVFLRVSGDKQVVLNRTETKGLAGDLQIDAGAIINGINQTDNNGASQTALQSVLLDASKSTQLNGDILMDGGSLSLNANAINIGEVEGLEGDGISFSNEKLTNLTIDELQMNSRKSINFYGNVGQVDENGNVKPLTFGSLILNAAGFSGFDNKDKQARLQADSLRVSNLFGAKDTSVGNGQGSLDLLTDNYVQGSGDFGINGFKTVNINVSHNDEVAQGFTADGKSVLKVNSDFNLKTDYLTSTGGAHLTIDAQGHNVAISGNGFNANPKVTHFGGSIDVLADTVNFDTKAYLPSGQLGLNALKGDIRVNKNATIDLGGQKIQFADIYDYTPGGTFSAVADKGKVILANKSVLNLNPGGDIDAEGYFIPMAKGGNLILEAPEKSVKLSGTINAAVGSAKIEIATFDPSANFDKLMGQLNSAGISDSIYFRTRQAKIVQESGKEINANSITLVADKKGMGLSGTLNADGPADGKDGGAIELYAGGKINLKAGGVLTATGGKDSDGAITGKGGKVLISSVESDDNDIGGIAIKSGSLIDVSGNTSEQGGKVILRALRTKTNDDGTYDNINIDKIEGTVKGYSQFFAEGVKKYSNADIGNDGEINANDIAKIKEETDAYMAAANVANLGSNIVLRPGVEIDYQGNLILQDKWDFLEWRYNGVPGNLVISTSGDFTVDNSITDGFLSRPDFATFQMVDDIQTDDSWSYQLTAGSDLTSADKFATISDSKSGSGKLLIGSKERDVDFFGNRFTRKVSVRSGTGDIQLASGGDVQLLNQFATVYSAGKAEENNRYGTITDPLFAAAFNYNAEYPVAGGDLLIRAGRDIIGVENSQQFITGWLQRIGDWGSNQPIREGDTRTPTAWGVNLTNFGQNVGSFGGGNVDISASGNINKLSVMMPTSGKQVGKPYEDGSRNETGVPKFETNVVTVSGGGDMTVAAGGDIAGGTYLLGKGAGSMEASGKILGQGNNVDGPYLVLGDTNFALNARQGVSVNAVSDVMAISESTQFYTYTDTSGLTIKSLSGDVNLGSDTTGLPSVAQDAARVYPASLQTTAFGGSIIVDNVSLYPSSTSTLSLLAKQNISGKTVSTSSINMLDVDLLLVPTMHTPKIAGLGSDSFAGIFSAKSITPVPVLHDEDKVPARLITREGDINQIRVTLSKAAILQAGRDLGDLNLDIQNINSDDVTHLNAGRDLTNDIQLISSGALDTSSNATIKISGPGDVLVRTGRNINLGVAGGINTVGNKDNSNLPRAGSNITVLAGLNGHQLDYSKFITTYLPFYPEDNNFKEVSALITDFMRNRLGNPDLTETVALSQFKPLEPEEYLSIQPELNALIIPVYENNNQLSYQGVTNEEIITSLNNTGSPEYDSLVGKYLQHFEVAEDFVGAKKIVTDYMFQRYPNAGLSEDQALAQFKDEKADDILPIEQNLNNAVLPVYYNEVNEAGSASAADPALGNDRGFTAINTLFPGSEKKTDDSSFPWKGDLSLIFSTIQTQQGGNINLALPGGQINAGLAFAFSGLNKPENQLGIIALEEGSINAVIRDDFQVNESRVFTQNGGNIMIWSTEGDIDAGKGAKTALSIAETEVTYTKSGKITRIKPPVSGKGIRAVVALTDIYSIPGDVLLFAPGGVINAGEAGIECNNCTFSATAVLGASNVQIGGVSTGVPVASIGSVSAGLSGVSNLNASVSQAAQASADMGKDTEESNKKKVRRGRLTVKVLRAGA